MTVFAFTSIAGSPGVTTAALASAVHWPRPVVVFELDNINATSAMAGFFRTNLPPSSGGLDKVSIAYARGSLGWQDLLDPQRGLSIAVHDLPPVPQMPLPSLPDGHRMWVVPGFYRLAIVDGVRDMWSRFPQLFRSISQAGFDVIVDLGRITPNDMRLPILDGADRVIVLASSTMVDLNRIFRRAELPDLSERLGGIGIKEKYRLALVTSPYESVPAADFSEHVMPVLTSLPFDPAGAAVFSFGRPDPKPNRNSYRQAIRRAVAAIDEQSRTEFTGRAPV